MRRPHPGFATPLHQKRMERGLFRESIFPSELEKAAVENPEEPAAVPGHDGA